MENASSDKAEGIDCPRVIEYRHDLAHVRSVHWSTESRFSQAGCFVDHTG